MPPLTRAAMVLIFGVWYPHHNDSAFSHIKIVSLTTSSTTHSRCRHTVQSFCYHCYHYHCSIIYAIFIVITIYSNINKRIINIIIIGIMTITTVSIREKYIISILIFIGLTEAKHNRFKIQSFHWCNNGTQRASPIHMHTRMQKKDTHTHTRAHTHTHIYIYIRRHTILYT